MSRVKMDTRKKISSARLAAAVAAVILMTVAFWRLFYSTVDAQGSFVQDNFSNSITSDNQTDVYFTAGRGTLRYLTVSFIPNSPSSESTTMHVTLKTEEGTVLYEGSYDYTKLYKGQAINILPFSTPAAGERLILSLASDAAEEDAAYRIPMGICPGGEIDKWTYNGITDTEITPGIHIFYYRFGLKSFAVYLAGMLLAVFLLCFPKSGIYLKVKDLFGAAVMLAAPAVRFVLSEFLSFNSAFDKSVPLMICRYLLIMGFELAIYALSGSGTASVIAAVLFTVLLSTANHYVMIFRSSEIVPSDIYSIKTAGNVISSYAFKPDMTIVLTVTAVLVLVMAALRYCSKRDGGKDRKQEKGKLALRMAGRIAAAAFIWFSTSQEALDFAHTEINLYRRNISATQNGFMVNFFQNFRYLILKKPDGYDEGEVRRISTEYISDRMGQEKPDVIVIMNETLCDLSMFCNLPVNEDPLEFMHSIEKDSLNNTHYGKVVVPVFGGGTCNSEFEGITGLSMSNFENGCIPYAQYMNSYVENGSRYYSNQGYATHFIHPGRSDSYNRGNVYKALGFDDIRFMGDMTHVQLVRGLVTDGECYKEILDILDGSDTPSFIFNVTIQNHGGYEFKITDDIDLLDVSGIPEEDMELATYLQLMDLSDGYFESFIRELEKRDRPVLVLMFGDHHPAMNLQNYEYLGLLEQEQSETLNKYVTPVVLWTNMDVDMSSIPEYISANYLMCLYMEYSGCGMSGYAKFLKQLMEEYPVYSLRGVYDKEMNEVADESVKDTYKMIQYAILKERDSFSDGFFTG